MPVLMRAVEQSVSLDLVIPESFLILQIGVCLTLDIVLVCLDIYYLGCLLILVVLGATFSRSLIKSCLESSKFLTQVTEDVSATDLY